MCALEVMAFVDILSCVFVLVNDVVVVEGLPWVVDGVGVDGVVVVSPSAVSNSMTCP